MSNAETSAPNTATQNSGPTSLMSRISSLEDNVHVLQSGGGSICPNKVLSIHHLTAMCQFSNDFSCSRPGYFHSKGHLIRRLVSLYDMADDMLAEADRRANATDTGVVVNHTDKCMAYIMSHPCC